MKAGREARSAFMYAWRSSRHATETAMRMAAQACQWSEEAGWVNLHSTGRTRARAWLDGHSEPSAGLAF